MADITANGLDLPKQQMVDDYLGQISEITSMITDAENAAKLQMMGTQYSGADLLSGDTFQNLQQSIQEYTEDANAGIDESYQKNPHQSECPASGRGKGHGGRHYSGRV